MLFEWAAETDPAPIPSTPQGSLPTSPSRSEQPPSNNVDPRTVDPFEGQNIHTTMEAKDFRMGMNEVYAPPAERNPVANVVPVHGLFGGPWKTWAAKARSPRSGVMSMHDPTSSTSSVDGPANYKRMSSKQVFWPESLLPSTVENVKVYSFGYDADVEKFMSSAGLNTVHQHGRNLFNELYALRDSQVPTIIVAHSLGGLVVKEALNQSAHSAQQDERDVVSTTSGIIFLGTPHRGSNAASYGRMAYLLTKAFAFQSANTKLLSALEKNSETLDRISTEFFQTLETYKNLRITSFSEEKQVRFGVLGMQIVRPDSAKIGHARETWGSISEDHRNMTKYSTSRDDGFVKVSRKIKEWVSDVQKQMSSTELKAYEECLNSLDDPVARFRVQEVDQVRQYNKTTFEWLFTNQVPFSRWLSDDRGDFDAIIWITGRPGSGKSTLMRFALEDSRTMSLQPSNSEGHPLAYFFHLRGKSLVQKSLRGMLMELLYQVLERYPRSFELICPIFLNNKRLEQDWNIGSLTEAMLKIPHIPPAVPGRRDYITIFVDALDEHQNQDDNNKLLSIFDNLNATYGDVRTKPNVPVLKICLASRPWPIFQQRLGDDPRVPAFAIHDFTMSDIREYTNNRFLMTSSRLKSNGERQKTISRLSTEIASRANGVFIWVKVVVDNLRQDIIDGTPIASLLRILHEYPEELDDMYKFTLKRIRATYRPETMIIFKILLASRVPLTTLQLYLITHICIGSPQYNLRPPNSSDIITSWLASRSGGLIDIVGTSAEERLSAASDGGAEKPIEKPASDPLVEPDLHVDFIHQTVQDFVRNSLEHFLDIIKPQLSTAQLSGSRLLALACLDSHPPHSSINDVAKDIFSYIREVESEDEDKLSQQVASLPHWNSFDLHDFPFRIRRIPGHTESTTPQILSQYLDLNNQHVQKLIGKAEASDEVFNGDIPGYMAPFVLTILQNLYHTKASENLVTLAPESRKSGRHTCLFLSSVGPRLSRDRLDRLRMFHRVRGWFELEGPSRIPHQLPYSPINQLFDNIPRYNRSPALAQIIVSLKPSLELDDETLLSLVEGLYGEGYDQMITLQSPREVSRRGRRKLAVGNIREYTTPYHYPGVEMTLSAFCSRFRETNRSKWVELFGYGLPGISPIYFKDDAVGPRPFVDLATWDVIGKRVPHHFYTDLATADIPPSVMPQTIASTGILAAVVGMGGSQIFRAFYFAPDVDANIP